MSLREFSSFLGVLCIAALLWRCIPYWVEMTWLERSFGVVMGLSIAVGAIGSYRLDMLNAPSSGVIWGVIATRFLVLGICAVWPVWMRLPMRPGVRTLPPPRDTCSTH